MIDLLKIKFISKSDILFPTLLFYFFMTEYKLPKLHYEYDKLEPFVDEETMKVHHTKHHAAYVKGLNGVLEEMNEGKSLSELISSLCTKKEGYSAEIFRNLTLCAGGHFNHAFYFRTMAPVFESEEFKTEDAVDEKLKMLIEQKCGKFEKLVDEFAAQAAKTVGSGWVYLVLPLKNVTVNISEETNTMTEKESKITQTLQANQLAIVSTKNQESPMMFSSDLVPILAMDIWEHAYYLKHNADKASYVHDWFKVVDWRFISEVYKQTHSGEKVMDVEFDGEIVFVKK